MDHATTLNEPNLMLLLATLGLPPAVWQAEAATLAAGARAVNSPRYSSANVATAADVAAMMPNLHAGHIQGYQAIKAARPALPVGVSLAIEDDEAVGDPAARDRKRQTVYAPWFATAKAHADFIGVQNYTRRRIGPAGSLPPPAGAVRGQNGDEAYAPSLANAVRYAHQATGLPVMVTEHGLATSDDTQRARFIPAALTELKRALDEGVPVRGYVHWSLLDNFEWIFGYRITLGLCSVDRTSFARTPKPSAAVLGAIARRNAV